MTTPNDLAEQLQQYTAEYFLEDALSHVPDDIDTRQGSIIYDALAPMALGFESLTIEMMNIIREAYIQTATGEFLDYKAQEKGTARILASNAEVSAVFLDDTGSNVSVEVGDRFATISAEPVFFMIKQVTGLGSAILVAETAGTVGNGYIGQLLPVTPNDNIATAMIKSITVPARDDESDDDLRERLLLANSSIRYGGNVADYVTMTSALNGVGAVQAYPAWNGGGTVRLVILNNNFDAPSPELIDEVKQAIDPQDLTGSGYGLAPIGHTVTVASPTVKTVSVALKIVTNSATSVDSLTATINKTLSDYFLGLRKKWDVATNVDEYSVTVYRAALIGELIKIDGIVNIESIKLNDSENDVALEFTNQLQELPILGEVTING